jgi:chromosomal replication initiator protein
MRPTIRHIQETVAEHFGVAPDIMRDPKCCPNSAANEPRQVAMFFAREKTGHSYPMIARKFKRKNHTTIWHAHRKIKRMIEENDAFAEDMHALAMVIGSGETNPVDNSHCGSFVAESESA